MAYYLACTNKYLYAYVYILYARQQLRRHYREGYSTKLPRSILHDAVCGEHVITVSYALD
jgi:hypothetical protein